MRSNAATVARSMPVAESAASAATATRARRRPSGRRGGFALRPGALLGVDGRQMRRRDLGDLAPQPLVALDDRVQRGQLGGGPLPDRAALGGVLPEQPPPRAPDLLHRGQVPFGRLLPRPRLGRLLRRSRLGAAPVDRGQGPVSPRPRPSGPLRRGRLVRRPRLDQPDLLLVGRVDRLDFRAQLPLHAQKGVRLPLRGRLPRRGGEGRALGQQAGPQRRRDGPLLRQSQLAPRLDRRQLAQFGGDAVDGRARPGDVRPRPGAATRAPPAGAGARLRQPLSRRRQAGVGRFEAAPHGGRRRREVRRQSPGQFLDFRLDRRRAASGRGGRASAAATAAPGLRPQDGRSLHLQPPDALPRRPGEGLLDLRAGQRAHGLGGAGGDVRQPVEQSGLRRRRPEIAHRVAEAGERGLRRIRRGRQFAGDAPAQLPRQLRQQLLRQHLAALQHRAQLPRADAHGPGRQLERPGSRSPSCPRSSSADTTPLLSICSSAVITPARSSPDSRITRAASATPTNVSRPAAPASAVPRAAAANDE